MRHVCIFCLLLLSAHGEVPPEQVRNAIYAIEKKHPASDVQVIMTEILERRADVRGDIVREAAAVAYRRLAGEAYKVTGAIKDEELIWKHYTRVSESLGRLKGELGAESVPLLVGMFLEHPFSDEPVKFHEVVFELLTAMDSETACDAVVLLGRELLTRGPKVVTLDAPKHSPLYQQDEFFALYVEECATFAWPRALARHKRFFVDVYTCPFVHFSVHIHAYSGFLKACLDEEGISPVDQVKQLLNDLKSPGEGGRDYHKDIGGMKDWAIKDAARCQLLVSIGPAGLPPLEAAWEELRTRKGGIGLNRRQRAIAEILDTIYFNALELLPDKLPETQRECEELPAFRMVPRFKSIAEKFATAAAGHQACADELRELRDHYVQKRKQLKSEWPVNLDKMHDKLMKSPGK